MIFFPEKNAEGDTIDYAIATTGGLHLVPDGAALDLLAEDYRRMVEDGLLLDDAGPFEELIERCRQIEQRANAATKTGE